jgi:hypothetical protein
VEATGTFGQTRSDRWACQSTRVHRNFRCQDQNRNFWTEPETILSHASARANCTNRNFRCLTETSSEYQNFRMETGIKYSHADTHERQFPELPVQLTGTYGARLSSLLSFNKSTFIPILPTRFVSLLIV